MSSAIILPLPVSLNKLYRRTKGGRVRLSNDAVDYKQGAQWQMRAAGVQPVQGNVALTIRVYRKYYKGDLDNYLKLLLDTLEGFAYHNDKQVVEIHAYRYNDKNNPRVEIDVQAKQLQN